MDSTMYNTWNPKIENQKNGDILLQGKLHGNYVIIENKEEEMVKKNDIVTIKTYDMLVSEFGEPDENGTIICGYTYPNPKSSRKVKNYFTKNMQKLCGMMGIVTAIEAPNRITLNDARYLDPDYTPSEGEDTLSWMFDFSESMFVKNA